MPPNFITIVGTERWQKLSRKKRRWGLNSVRAAAPVDAHIRTVNEEYALYVGAYTQLSATLPELHLSAKQIDDLVRDLVDNHKKYIFYSDATEVIPLLSQHCHLGIISDAWPSLEGVFDAAGLREYFEVFVLSSQIGEAKPQPAMYQAAMLSAHVQPERALFVDDSFVNCTGATRLGMFSILLCRQTPCRILEKITHPKTHVISNLRQLICQP